MKVLLPDEEILGKMSLITFNTMYSLMFLLFQDAVFGLIIIPVKMKDWDPEFLIKANAGRHPVQQGLSLNIMEKKNLNTWKNW